MLLICCVLVKRNVFWGRSLRLLYGGGRSALTGGYWGRSLRSLTGEREKVILHFTTHYSLLTPHCLKVFRYSKLPVR